MHLKDGRQSEDDISGSHTWKQGWAWANLLRTPSFTQEMKQWSLRIKRKEEGAEINPTTTVNIIQRLNKKWASKDQGHIELQTDMTREDSLYSI